MNDGLFFQTGIPFNNNGGSSVWRLSKHGPNLCLQPPTVNPSKFSTFNSFLFSVYIFKFFSIFFIYHFYYIVLHKCLQACIKKQEREPDGKLWATGSLASFPGCPSFNGCGPSKIYFALKIKISTLERFSSLFSCCCCVCPNNAIKVGTVEEMSQLGSEFNTSTTQDMPIVSHKKLPPDPNKHGR